jgi:TonB-dependent SusC/RagA subfamily outer membrane receptor
MMLLAWMLQATVLGALVSAAAIVLEPLVHRRRWVWLTTLIVTAMVPLLALLAPSAWPDWVSWRVAPALQLPAAPAGSGEATRLASGRGALPGLVPLAWTLVSLLCLTRYVEGWLRLRLLSRGCARVRVSGRELLLSEGLGPAVVGLWRPRVVAPRWITTMPAARQRMIVLHEAEHVRAGDAWVLAAAPLLAIVLPWNLSLWWQLRRLRLAVELDCDARVLSHGVRPLEYGGLLLDVAGSEGALIAPALAEPRSLLERRLEAVVRRRRRPGPARCVALASAAVVAVLSGCLVAAPARVVATPASATPAARDPAPAETGVPSDTVAVLTATRAALRAGDRTARPGASTNSRVARVALGASDVIPVTGSTRERAPLPAVSPADTAEALALTGDAVAVGPVPADTTLRETAPLVVAGGPLFIVDGVLITGGSFAGLGLEPDDIDSIEVIKGAAAAARYGTRGADGVVSITTRRGGPGR